MSIADSMAQMASSGMGAKPAPKPAMGDKPEHEGEGAKEMIHAHLAKMHELHGGAHTHIHHHPEGHHEEHHVTESGEVSGPHEHDSSGCAECEGGGEDAAGENEHEGLM